MEPRTGGRAEQKVNVHILRLVKRGDACGYGSPMPTSDPQRSRLRPGPGRPFDDDVDEVIAHLDDSPLPRRQAGGAPQNLAVTLMADFTLRTRAWVPSAAIVALLAQFDVSISNARTAISRLARRGVLEAAKHGRNTSYRLSASSANQIARAGRLLANHPRTAELWDGTWSLVAFSLPHQQSAERRALRGQLRWQGFAPVYDGLWARPMPVGADDVRSLTDIAPNRITVFRAEHRSFPLPTGRTPLDAWDLDALATRFREFTEFWQAHPARSGPARLPGQEALRARIAVIDQYRLLPLLDPAVPLSYLPPGWPRARAHDTLTAVYDGLADPSLRHVLRVITDVCGETPAGMGTHTVAEMADGLDTVKRPTSR